jgi:hypothetical protein
MVHTIHMVSPQAALPLCIWVLECTYVPRSLQSDAIMVHGAVHTAPMWLCIASAIICHGHGLSTCTQLP